MAPRPSAFVVGAIATLLAVGLSSSTQSGAKALFGSRNPRQNVGIHAWLQSRDGTRLTPSSAAAFTGPFTLHVRSNTAGFLGVWTTSDGAMLTPMSDGYSGHLLPELAEYVVPGDFRLSRSQSDGRVIVLFARSQTEQVREAKQAAEKLDRLTRAMNLDGHPSMVTEVDDSRGTSTGTYVVNRDGNQPGVVLPLTR